MFENADDKTVFEKRRPQFGLFQSLLSSLRSIITSESQKNHEWYKK